MAVNGENPALPERAIAIVGMSARFPGAPSVSQYWANLRTGICSLRDFTREELLADGADPALLDRPGFVPAKGFLEAADRFEAELFGFTRTEAAVLDPQHRLLLESAWRALEDAGRNPRDVRLRTGVYVGGGTSEHMIAAMADSGAGADLGALNVRLLTDKDFLASWISYRLGLGGPSMAVQTACSTSLTAVHVAVQALLLGECDLALAGGAAIDTVRREGYLHQTGGIMSRDGRCRPFSEDSDGTVPGNGVGVVALRRLEDAVADGDPIHAVIRGTAAVNDGADKIGFTAPSERGQHAAMVEALAAADVDPATVGYIEMHGTATALGDRIEVAATAAAYAGAADVGIGSVKSNLGHLDAAAGVAGLIKAVLMVSHGEFVPTVNVGRPNPELALDKTPLRLVDAAAPWTTPTGTLRRAAVSSVGLGGSNVHVILEQAPAVQVVEVRSRPDEAVLLTVSARTPEQVQTSARNLADALERDASLGLAETADTLTHARARLAGRGFVVARSRAEAIRGLQELAERAVPSADAAQQGGAIFVFPGQASQYMGMGAELYQAYPVFREAMNRCAAILTESHGIDPRSWTKAAAAHVAHAGTRGATDYWQPTIVSIEYAAVTLLHSWGVEPAAIVGHSIGEYLAAHLAGVFTLEDALRLVAERGRLMAKTPAGAMRAVRAAAPEITGLLNAEPDPKVDLAAVNGPLSCVVSGTTEAIGRFAETLDARKIEHRDLGVDYAFHSRLMDDILEDFEAAVVEAAPKAPTAGRYVSTVSGDWITTGRAADPAFWAGQIRRPVLFAQALAKAGETAAGPVIEVGPGAGLAAQARHTLGDRPAFVLLGRGDTEQISALTALGELWRCGADLARPAEDAAPVRRVHLPGYPFDGTPYGALSLRRVPAGPSIPTIAAEPADEPAEADVPEPEDAAQQSLEEQVAELLRSTLGVSAPDDLALSYLAAGGESLTAVHLIGRLREELGIEAPIALLLEPMPLRELAARIAGEGTTGQDGLLAELLDELEAESDDS